MSRLRDERRAMKTIGQRIREDKIRIESEYAEANPNMGDEKWQANHYKVILKRKGKQLTTFFSMGLAHTQEPTAEDVLNSLASDAAGIENARSFEDWCNHYGYDTDSRRAEKTFNVCERQAEKLKSFLGEELYKQYLFNTESL
jgi:hypothetical protein